MLAFCVGGQGRVWLQTVAQGTDSETAHLESDPFMSFHPRGSLFSAKQSQPPFEGKDPVM